VDSLARSSRALWLALVVALGLAAPSLGAALYCDDALFVARLENALPSPRPGPLWLYTLATGGSENLTPYWWTAPELRIAFFRPLASGLLALDHAFFGRAPLPYHVHSIAWFLASVLMAGLLLRRLLSPRAGALATLLFAVSPMHSMVASWPAARHVAISATLGFLALLLHVRARETKRAPAAAVLAMAVALLSSEVALGVLAFVVSYEVFGRDDARAARLKAALPCVVLATLYIVAYGAMGYGVTASGDYADPIKSPLSYLRNVPRHVGPLAFSTFFGVPSESSVAFPAIVPMTLLLGAMGTLVAALLLRRAWRLAQEEDRRALRWLLPGAALATLPGLSGIVGDRALFVPSLGITAALAIIILNAARRDAAGRRPVIALVGVSWLLLFQLPLGSLSFFAQAVAFMKSSRAAADVVRAADLPTSDSPSGRAARVFGIGIADPTIGMYLQPVRVVNGGAAQETTMLTVSLHDHVVTRSADRTLVIQIVDGSLLESGFETVVRPRSLPLHEGDVVTIGETRIVVVAAKDGAPTRLAVEFDRPLDDPSLAIVIWKQGALRRMPTLALGESVRLPHEKGPSGF
jgi:hypothetical protein